MSIEVGANIRRQRQLARMTQPELASILHVARQTVSSWEVGRTEPNMGMIETIAKALGCVKSDITGKDGMSSSIENASSAIVPDEGQRPVYHYDAEAAQIAQEIFDDKNLRALFQAARSSDAENIKMAATILERMKGTNPDG